MRRRGFIASAASAVCAPAIGKAQAPVDRYAARVALRQEIVSMAEERARTRYENRAVPLPRALAELEYDQFRRIESQHDENVWRGGLSGFEVQPLPRGWIYEDQVNIHLVEDAEVREMPYEARYFRISDERMPQVDGEIGFSGVRLMAEIGETDVPLEFMVFQGASYFRALAPALRYGLSARGVAVRTADPRGEEFPAFTDLWIERPAPGAREIVLHALLDGPSVTGAYMFTVSPGFAPGEPTRVGTNATLFARADMDHVGLAPLTSMYWFSPLEPGEVDDFRPRVHDSEGLVAAAESGEWLWRPLANPTRLQISSFGVGTQPRGFGLAQRARDWEDFQDPEAVYEKRPGAWIAPHANWPAGRVELIEIPTNNEFNDNIVAYWRLADVLPAGEKVEFGYDTLFEATLPSGYGLMRVSGSLSGDAGPADKRPTDVRLMVVDFAPTGGAAKPAHFYEPKVQASGGEISNVALGLHEETGGLRLSFELRPTADIAELRAVIQELSRPVSETWLYRWTRA